MSVMIGIDPHKGSHAAVAVDEHEEALAEVQVRATRRQTIELLSWAQRFPNPQLGDRVCQRSRVSAGPTADRRW